jgi:hypothetical protein
LIPSLRFQSLSDQTITRKNFHPAFNKTLSSRNQVRMDF